MSDRIKTLLLILSIALPAFLLGLGDRPLYKIQEVRMAETSREMLVSGDWIVPRYNGELRLEKPPLPYWVTATSYAIGGINLTATRLPAAVFGLLTLVAVWAFTKRALGIAAATNAALVLASSFISLRYFRSGEADAILLLFVSLAALLGFELTRHAESGKRWLFALMLGLGFLTKGPAAFAMPMLALATLMILESRSWRIGGKLASLFSLSSLLLMLAIAAGWYVLIFLKLPDAAAQIIGRQVDDTYISGSHPKPIWWYFAHFFEFFAPWSLLIIPAAWLTRKEMHSSTLPPFVLFAWAWFGATLLLLTATVNKQMQYALLLAPPFAILAGHYLDCARENLARLNRTLFWLFCALMVVGIGFAIRKAGGFSPSLPAWLLIPALPVTLAWALKVRQPKGIWLVAGLTAMGYLYGEAHLSSEPRKAAAETIMTEAAQHSPLFQPRSRLNNGALSFYANRVVPPVDAAEINQLLKQYPTLWLVGDRLPEGDIANTRILTTVDELTLWQISAPDH
jgi:4-amino-4-deoxy-L-arabinose transferase-like glycosyltransferase